MDSIPTKSNNYSMVNGKAVAGVVLVPKAGSFIGYVAWEWENQAKKKIFAIVELDGLVDQFTGNWIDNIADYGTDVTHKRSAQKLFPNLF